MSKSSPAICASSSFKRIFVCSVTIDKVIARLDVLNITKSVLDGSATRKDKRLFDARCLREAFLNAVAHNDWKSKVSPAVYVFSNRIEIISTGGLPEGCLYRNSTKDAANLVVPNLCVF